MTFRKEMDERLKTKIGDGSVGGDGDMYRRWWSLYPDEAKAANRIAKELESRLEHFAQPKNDNEIYPWTEHAFAEKEAKETSIQHLLDAFEDYEAPVNRELERYRKNLLDISKTYSRLQTEEARDYYRHGELKQDMVYHNGLTRRDEMVRLMGELRSVLAKSRAIKFPGNKRPQLMHDQVESYPVPGQQKALPLPGMPNSLPKSIPPPGPALNTTP